MADGEEEEKKIVVAGGAGEEEEEKPTVVVGAGDGEGEKKVGEGGERNVNVNRGNRNDGRLIPPPPPGFRFTPREDELVKYYLLPKLQGREHVPNDAIIEDNVYQSHPDKLTEKYRHRGEDSWHFLSPRARKYRNGVRPSRSTDDKLGRWKASTGTKVVVLGEDGGGGVVVSSSKTSKSKAAQTQGAAGDGKIKYSESTLSYYEGPIRNESKSRWLMKELTVPDYETKRAKNGAGGGAGDIDMLNQYVMCKIYVTPRCKGDGNGDEVEDEYEAGPSGTQHEPEEEREELSDKQAGKRPAKDQSATGSAPKRPHLNPDRLHLGPPAPLHGQGMQAPFRPPGYYGGGPGRPPIGFYARPPGPRPPMRMYNNGQAPVSFNGQVHVPRQQMAYNGGQVAPVPYEGQVQIPRHQVPYYYRQMMRPPPPVLKLSPPCRPAGAPSSSGQNQPMMKRPPFPAGQAVNPPSSVAPRPAQTQKQTETEEMRTNRVLRQHMEEYSRFKEKQNSARATASAAHAAQQQQRPTAFTHQQQQRPTAFTHHHQQQQQQRPTAFTHQQQQQQPTAFTHQQQYQQQRPMMAFTHHQQQQRPYFAPNANYHHHAGGMVPQFSLDNFYASEAAQHYQRSRAIPAASGSAGEPAPTVSASAEGLVSSVVSGAGNEVSGANLDCSNDAEMKHLESATAGGSASAADGDGGPKCEPAQ